MSTTPTAGLIARITEERHQREADPAYCAEQERIAAEENRRQEMARRKAVANSRTNKGIPEKTWPFLDAFRAGQLEDLPPSVAKAHQWVTRFLAGEEGWAFLFLGGSPGLGKTVSACWFLDAPWTGMEPDPYSFEGEVRKVTRESSGGLFVTAEKMAKTGTFGEDGETWKTWQDTPRLVIDDLGVERLDDKGWALANLSHLLYHRHAHQLSTVLTLNITRKAFEERYAQHDGGRLRDRLTESAMFVELTGPSLRRRLSLPESSNGAAQ